MLAAERTRGKETIATESQQETVATEATEPTTLAPATDEEKAQAAEVGKKIDAIYVQNWSEDTERLCKEAKEAWDALSDSAKAEVSGEHASPEYFGLDTGDVSKDDPRNQDEIGEKEILVVSFGTSYNDSRARISAALRLTLQRNSRTTACAVRLPRRLF